MLPNLLHALTLSLLAGDPSHLPSQANRPKKPARHHHDHIGATPLWPCCVSPAHAYPPQQLPAPQTTPARPSCRVAAAARTSARPSVLRAGVCVARTTHATRGHDDPARPARSTWTTRQRRAAASGHVPSLSSRYGRRAHLRASERPRSRRLRRRTRLGHDDAPSAVDANDDGNDVRPPPPKRRQVLCF